MKKILSAIISSPLKGRLGGVLFALLATTTLWAYDFQSGDLYYNITSDTTVEVTYQRQWSSDSYAGLTTATIPETATYNGTTYSVTSIGYVAFYGCSSLTSVTIPNSVTSIGNWAFSNCYSLTSVTIPNSVTSIGNYAFYYCYSLTSITIPNSVTSIGSSAFYYCSSLTSITIPNSVTSIGSWAFSYCFSLTSVTIPNSVTSIGSSAFYYTGIYNNESNWENGVLYIDNCLINSKTDISGAYTIKDNTRLIADYAFAGCDALTSITIPNSVTSIGEEAFDDCTFVKDNFINNSTLDAVANNYWDAEIVDVDADGLLIRNDTVIDCRPFVTSITIPNSVTSIGNSAFTYCDALTSITIPNSITSIGDYAFYNCDALTSVTIPNSVTSIGDYAFSSCSGLTKTNYIGDIASWCDIKFGNSSANPISESQNLYINDVEIKDLVIPNTVDSIHNCAFSGCSALTSITIPNSVISIGSSAFSGCSGLTSITIPNSVTSIGDKAFYYCEYLTSIYLPYNIPIVNQSSFNDYHYEQVKLYVPLEAYEAYKADDVWGKFKNILYINNFYENNIRYRYMAEENILSMSLLVEENFNQFTSISIIGSQDWHYNSKYGAYMSGYQNNVTNPNEDWLISPAMDLSKHSTVTLEFSHAFGPAASVPTTATQKAQYTCWISNDFNGDVTTATWTELPITYGTLAWDFITTTVNIPTENLKENCHIAWKYVCDDESATWEINNIEVAGILTKPAVEVIAKYDNYSNDVVIPSVVTHNYADYNVEAIAVSAFSGCTSLTSITIPNSVTSIGNNAFYDCSSLTSVTLGGKIESIGRRAFSGCAALNEITLPASVKSIGENAFAGCTKLYDIYCYAMEPPTAYDSSFANYNAFLHVPCDNQRVYLLDVLFGNFKYIECIEAETATTDTVVVDPSFNDAEFTWPSNSDADTYTLAISKDGEVFCTLTFNANGQLTGIAFAPSRNGQHNAPAAAQMANGFAFIVTGLDEGSNYTYDLLIQDRSGNTLLSYSGEFRTQSTKDRTVTVEYDAAQGQVTGAGIYLVGDTVTLTATPNDGYRFVRWSNEVEDNPYTFVISDNVKLSAEFEAVIHSSVENTHSPSPTSSCQKIFRNGQLLILRDGKTYNVMGQEM